MAFDEQNDGGAISQINVTPLVDVMLVLLVIFMVTAPILQQGVSISLPQVDAAPLAGDDDQLVVSISEKGEIFLNDTAIALDDLVGKLGFIVVEQPERQVYLRADEAVAYGEVMRVIGALKQAGVQRLGMVTEAPPV